MDVVDLFLKYIHPKHAVSLDRPDFFITHPEYMIQLSDCQMALTEIAAHPLAIRGGLPNLSYTLNPASSDVKVGFLNILGVSCEVTLKYIEQYYRWPTLLLGSSRFVNLSSWAYTFREHGSNAYSKTQTKVKLSGSTVISQERTPATGGRARYANAVMNFAAISFRLYELSGGMCKQEVRRCICLAMCLPGFRRKLGALGGPITVLLPVSDQVSDVLKAIENSACLHLFAKFCLMHVIPGRLQLKHGQTFRLRSPTSQAPHGGRIQILDSALCDSSLNGVTGKVISHPMLIDDDVIAYNAVLDYDNADNLLDELRN
jgi:hypothetical protein